MSGASRLEGFLVRSEVAWKALVSALSEILEVSPEAIHAFDIEHLFTPSPPVLVELQEHGAGFHLDLTLYLGSEVRVPLTGVALARRLAGVLGQDVLTSPPAREAEATSPLQWVLARPDGEAYRVHQINPESDDVEIDWSPASMRPWESRSGPRPLPT